MTEFSLRGESYIELDKLMKILRLVNSGGEAHLFITDGAVKVNKAVETRKRKKLYPGDEVHFQAYHICIIH